MTFSESLIVIFFSALFPPIGFVLLLLFNSNFYRPHCK